MYLFFLFMLNSELRRKSKNKKRDLLTAGNKGYGCEKVFTTYASRIVNITHSFCSQIYLFEVPEYDNKSFVLKNQNLTFRINVRIWSLISQSGMILTNMFTRQVPDSVKLYFWRKCACKDSQYGNKYIQLKYGFFISTILYAHVMNTFSHPYPLLPEV